MQKKQMMPANTFMRGMGNMQIMTRKNHSSLRCVAGMALFLTFGLFTQAPAVINVTSNFLSCSNSQWSAPVQQTFEVMIDSNRPTPNFFWVLTSNAWLSVSPANARSADNYCTITTTFHTANLDPGTYTSEILIVSPLITNFPVVLPVTCTVYEVNDVPGLRIAPDCQATMGRSITVPIHLVSSGDVNAVGFSLNFNRGILSSPSCALGDDAGGGYIFTNVSQVSSAGRIGITISANSTSDVGSAVNAFAAGTQEIARIRFDVAANRGPGPQMLSFTNNPVLWRFADTNGDPIAGVRWGDGNVLLTAGLEADSSSRPIGSGSLTVADWVQVGRFVAGLDTRPLLMPGEFQRADCAPRSMFGDGYLSVMDWTQAGRYVAGIDGNAVAAGPTNAFPTEQSYSSPLWRMRGYDRMVGARCVSIPDAAIPRGETNFVDIILESQGNENAVGFTLRYDSAVLGYAGAVPGDDARHAVILPNSTRMAEGLLGFAMVLPVGESFARGQRQILRIRFVAPVDAPVDRTVLSFTDDIVVCEVCNARALDLSATFNAADIPIIGTPRPPSKLLVGKGAGIDGILLEWDHVPGATQGYQIWRGRDNQIEQALLIATTDTPSYTDFSAQFGLTYYYWVRALNLSGASAFSKGDYGVRRFAPISPSAGMDFDGDGLMDTYEYNETTGAWTFWLSSLGYGTHGLKFGGAGCVSVPADYDGDGRIDPAVYHADSGVWHVLCSAYGYNLYKISLGGAGCVPVPADYDGDGKADFAVYNDASAVWLTACSLYGYEKIRFPFGEPGKGALPAPADYDGDGKADPALYNSVTAVWQAMLSGNGYQGNTVEFGGIASGGVPVSADYDGDGLVDYAVYNAVSGKWHFCLSAHGSAIVEICLGGLGYIPLPADYDGDGKADPAAYYDSSLRGAAGQTRQKWLVRLSSMGYLSAH